MDALDVWRGRGTSPSEGCSGTVETKRVLGLPGGKKRRYKRYNWYEVGEEGEAKEILSPTSFFHGNNPITEPTIIHRRFINLVGIPNRSFQRCLLGQDVFELHGVRRPSSDAWPRR